MSNRDSTGYYDASPEIKYLLGRAIFPTKRVPPLAENVKIAVSTDTAISEYVSPLYSMSTSAEESTNLMGIAYLHSRWSPASRMAVGPAEPIVVRAVTLPIASAI